MKIVGACYEYWAFITLRFGNVISPEREEYELFIQVLWGKVAIFTQETNPRVNCGCLSLQVNTVVMIWGCDGFLAKWQPIFCQLTC